MGLTRSGAHKRKATGGKKGMHRNKRKYALARPPANTKIGENRVKKVRTRGGNFKLRALRLNKGSFTNKSTNDTKVYNIEKVVYHPSNNEFVRMNLLTKSSVVLLENDIYGIITSQPSKIGTINGYLLQNDELAFYENKMKTK